jgi:uncharacterized membrane protein
MKQGFWLIGLALVSLPLQLGFSPAPAGQTQSNGLVLAVAIMIGMAAALIFVGVTWARAWKSDLASAPSQATWIDAAMLVLIIAGLAVAGYLTYVETQAVAAVCGPVGDCNAVQTSSYARLFGVLPVGLLGMIGYVAILVAWLWGRFRSDRLADYAPLAVHGMAIFGALFSLYLTFLEPFVIKAVCLWCLTSAVVMTLVMLLSLPLAAASFVSETEET